MPVQQLFQAWQITVMGRHVNLIIGGNWRPELLPGNLRAPGLIGLRLNVPVPKRPSGYYGGDDSAAEAGPEYDFFHKEFREFACKANMLMQPRGQ